MTSHNAPPVVYPLGRSHMHAAVLAGLWFAGLLSVLLWVNASRSVDWRALVAVAAILAAGLAAFLGWKSSPTGQLAWDGQIWRWESLAYQAGVSEQKLFVIADLQNLLLLRLENQAHANLWLWVERKTLPERWLDLRRAVYSPHKAVSGLHQSDFKYAQARDIAKVQP